MQTTLYWTIRHIRCAWGEFRFRAACWRLSRRVEFAAWRVRTEALAPTAQRGTRRMTRAPVFRMF
jgi:hypothetical protein